MTAAQTDLRALRAQLAECLAKDRDSLGKKLHQLTERQRKNQPHDKLLSDVQQAIERSVRQRQARLASTPTVHFANDLPFHDKLDDIAAALQQHQVVIVCGETGSGKTTQLPKLCLALGRGVDGLIGHTQPRRLAARSVASRIAQELKSPLGQLVGYQVRFADHVSPDSRIKLMTDGILLAETQGDRQLLGYDTLIIDEAHERSLNIDFLLGYLKQLLPRRPDLKVIITSATIDADRFSRHFGGAPVIEVSGRTYPVEMRYRPLLSEDEDDRETDMEQSIVEACDELSRLGPGDILVFLPGEREIRDTAEALRKHHRAGTEILPLFARLSHEDQQKVFAPHGGRRIVLATNVAETSLTVPGIRYVVDTGLARINRYSTRAKVTQLLIEPISQAAARQRAGRCGRVSAGVCIRLYSETDFQQRPAFTDPEILRSSLASVILRMTALRLGAVEDFPFLEAPTSRAIHDGYQLLHELGAVDEQRQLTRLGERLAKLPLDPKIGRLLLAGEAQHCLQEMLIIATGLSMQDPRERPVEAREAATQKHAVFADDKSDFLSYLKLWDWFADALKHKESNRKLVQRCHDHFLSHLRLREWRELHGQLASIAAEIGLRSNDTPATFEQIHKALLCGLLGNTGFLTEQGDYLGARGSRFWVSPGSGLKKSRPKWLLAAELTDTGKLYARCVARIEPEWVEQVARHLVKSHYFDPRWDRSSKQVIAFEKVTLFGLTLVPRRRVSYSQINPGEARELFIREALVHFDYDSKAPFFRHNQQLIAEVEELEHRSRRQDVLVNADRMVAFFDALLPPDICSGASFEHWRKEAEQKQPRLLFLSKEQLMQRDATHVTEALFPDQMTVKGHTLPLSYRFEPGHPLDGVSVTVPLALLNTLQPLDFDALVPGMLREKVGWLVKALPKPVRRLCVPVPDTVTELLEKLRPGQPLLPELVRLLQLKTQQPLRVEDWPLAELPPHLQMNYRVVDEALQELASGRDLLALQRELGGAAQLTFRQSAAAPLEQSGLTEWTCGDLPESLHFTRNGASLTGYPALVDMDDSVAVMLLDTTEEAHEAHRAGVRRLLRLVLKDHLKQWQKSLPNWTQLAMQLRTLGNSDVLLEDFMTAVADRAFIGEDALPRSSKAFDEQRARARTRLPAVTQGLLKTLGEIAALWQPLLHKLEKPDAQTRPLAATLKAQLQQLVFPDFLQQTPWPQLAHLPRYLKGMQLRLEKYPTARDRDQRHAQALHVLWQRYQARASLNQQLKRHEPKLDDFRWMLEELHISLFAQELRTPYPVSVKRLEKYWQDAGF
ncbi:ATP-dependent RNA helicase HrpA [Leeia aquatica]|uniref:ATP-dependent RNA helicase HrpA n=1 Tax=Leeia aquatica TaxID=2725557 RepID=A0A847SJ91_9NEIS|nr:ATP-dependent RNA helicase HrpA [Leeia aquatica]NLR75972.1 ATP-dependent RNA helicase HrpA [Leeia aquatica]